MTKIRLRFNVLYIYDSPDSMKFYLLDQMQYEENEIVLGQNESYCIS